MEKVLIKGAGDLATGIACRLHRCGFSVAMTEIAVPTTVRRTVAFSRAVYEGNALVEDIEGVLCRNTEEIDNTVNQDKVAVIVDPSCETLESWRPDIVVDAILAKVNLGSKMSDADIVIGVGPGFTAGEDCHVVVETKRGHNLGRCIWEGSAFPNTGVPGMVGGVSKERVIHSPGAGRIHNMAHIADIVEKGQILAYVGETPVEASITGVLRGIIKEGYNVPVGMKIADIDPRKEEKKNCFTISDKARCIAGSVVEILLREGVLPD